MSFGACIRAALGPLEIPIVRLYRGYFVDLARLAEEIHAGGPAAAVLEVGCGEGSLTEEISKRFPESSITGIDISPRSRIGRLYQGDRARISFEQATIEQIADTNGAAYDLIILADVLHHVLPGLRQDLLLAIRRALRPGGLFVIKDWERRANLAHGLAWFSDRFISGDRGVQFFSMAELRDLVERVFGSGCIERETRIRPQPNNVALFVRDRMRAT